MTPGEMACHEAARMETARVYGRTYRDDRPSRRAAPDAASPPKAKPEQLVLGDVVDLGQRRARRAG